MRLFFALFPPGSPDLDQLYDDLAFAGENLKRVPPRKMHFTVKFLGEVRQKLDDISRVADSVISGYEGFDMEYGGAGAFPSWRKPSVIWLGVKNGEKLELLASDLDRTLNEEIMVKKEKRPFKAHLTVARSRRGRRIDIKEVRKVMERSAERLEGGDPNIPVRRIHLCSSKLTPDGPIYERVREFRLK
jgi:2'-5' RNA ligase